MTGRPWLRASDPPVEAYDVALLDLDGVVYVGPRAVPHAPEVLTEIVRRGMVTAFVTNNASRPPAQVADHLRALGIAATADSVVTSAQAGARMVADLVPPGAAVLALGGPGVVEALRERGLVPVEAESGRPTAVLQGFGPDVGWRLLAEGAFALARGVPWVATNLDLTIPTAGGIAPGNGALVGLLARHTGREPMVAGKPQSPLVRESVERSGATRPLMVGDRLDTDIEGAVRSGLDSMLVMTGVTGVVELLRAPVVQRPTYVAADLRGLLTPAPAVLERAGAWTCGSAVARCIDGGIRVDGTGGDPDDVLRAAAAAAWSATDHGGTVDMSVSAATVARAMDVAAGGTGLPSIT